MSFTQRLVSPKLPTSLENHTHVDLPGYDLRLFYANIVHVIPVHLDVSKFEEALSRVLQLYPHVAGQLRCIDGRWSIELTNTAVPVDIEYKLNMSTDSLLHDNWVIQDDISPFLTPEPVSARVINGSAPLLRLKLMFFDHETSLGISWYHSLGDATLLFRCIHTLSQFYQGLSPEFAAPTFKKYHFPTPSHSIMAEFWPRMPHLHASCDFDELAHAGSRKNLEYDGPLLSKQDCLVAYLVAVLNHNARNSVQKVTNVVSYRHLGTSFIIKDVASNLILDVTAKVPTDMAGIAIAVRDALVQCREPDYIYNWVMLASNVRLEAANAGRTYPLSSHDKELIVNSHTKIDWCSSHFGCPGGTQFHMDGVAKFFLRCYKPNPEKGVDGVWRARQSVEIWIGVPAALKPKLLATLSRGVRCMLGNQL